MIERLVAGKGAALYRKLDSPWWRIIDQATASLTRENQRSRKAKTARAEDSSA
jgi:alkylated DNA nucleotide flippase Atl1